MEALILEGNNLLPAIVLDQKNNRFELSGKSLQEDPESYYNQVLNWLDVYAKSPNIQTQFSFKLDYFNIASSKRILYILYKLNEIMANGNSVAVNWYYSTQEDDMYEVGQDFAFMVNVPFEFITYEKSLKETVLI